MSAVAPLEIRQFSELVNKTRVVEECAKKTALARDTRGGTNNRGRGSGEKCQGYILLATNASGDEQKLDRIPVVNEFSKVFPEDILEFPPQREIEFMIELMSGAGPVSIAPYRMASIELAKLKTQLEELLNKRFIRPSVSPWGALV
ncbi:uncharacterized protein LOC107640429 [Arachis ipaensis]|uniref:uncharacterized protein LOC107640429 n=1 Tax=Arachis ipaensis TaxID=130454 RepID=UPI0007AF1BE4|nr:uncharacterized protein LOC107640429 [Arachis ipaensis]